MRYLCSDERETHIFVEKDIFGCDIVVDGIAERHRPPMKENAQLFRMPEVIWLTRNSEEAYGDPQQGKDILLCSVQEVIWFCWTPESANAHA